ncbi:hypothetical protein GCM10009613_60800 [Pseudonocardia kongjuensis]|uniref:Uncharacterized protein n=2 Tax=Pseudonocardia kongjuensis TaxID=102227 RepID=A0ABP4IZF8_9PSEU
MFDAPDCAVALWTRAGVWVARHLQDGRVPAGLPARKCDDPERAVAELVRRGVWEPTEDGWLFVDWLEDQPSREQVLEKRRKETERKARMRGALAEKRRKARSARPSGTPGGTPTGTPDGSPTRSPALPDPGSLPSSGTPAAADGPPAASAGHVPVSSPEVRAAALAAVAAATTSRRRGRHTAPAGARPLMTSISDTASAAGSSSRPSRPADAQRAEQDRLAELDAVQVADAGVGGPSPPPATGREPVPDQQKRETG